MSLCSFSKTWITVDLDARSVGACCRTTQQSVVSDIDINNQWFTDLRQNLNNGIKDPKCSACWIQEETMGSSLRHSKIPNQNSLNPENSVTADLKYLEIRLGNQCDGACVYCGSNFSSKQAKFWKIHQNIPKPVNKEPLIDQTKKLIEQNKHTINTIVFIGGEPSIMERWYDFIDFISDIEFDSALSVVITTNANWKDKTKERLFASIEKFLLVPNKKLNVRISGEGDKEYFQSVRKFSDYDRVLDNVNDMSRIFGNKISYTMQPVINGLSIYSIEHWLNTFSEIFKSNNVSSVSLNFALLTRPEQFRPIYQGNLAVNSLTRLIEFLKNNKNLQDKSNVEMLDGLKMLLIDKQPNIEKLNELSFLLQSHDKILPNEWKSEDALSPIKNIL